jgi:hypothetical protein
MNHTQIKTYAVNSGGNGKARIKTAAVSRWTARTPPNIACKCITLLFGILDILKSDYWPPAITSDFGEFSQSHKTNTVRIS